MTEISTDPRQAQGEISKDEATGQPQRSLMQQPQYIIEGIILRRIHEKRIEGYTIEMAKEIAEALSNTRPNREGENG